MRRRAAGNLPLKIIKAMPGGFAEGCFNSLKQPFVIQGSSINELQAN